MEENIPIETLYNPRRRLMGDGIKQELTIYKYKRDILYLLEQNQVLIIKGETGCGKSTQIPQYLIEAGWHMKKSICGKSDPVKNIAAICISQPRRVSAIALAKRVAEEMNSTIGHKVGYAVRLDGCFSKESTLIKYVTDGLLLREMMSDPLLDKYCVVIVDEAHERNMNTDLLIGLLKRVLLKRNDLKIVICSATPDVERFVKFFTLANESQITQPSHEIEAPTTIKPAVLCVEGRSHPCEIFYSAEPVPDYVKASVKTAIKIHEMNSMTSGDILIFLTGQEEIEQAIQMLKEYSNFIGDRTDIKKLLILPLYSSLPSIEITKVFANARPNYRKCIVATNVAETSLTINGVVFVVDCGFAKLRFFDPITRSDSLVRVPISKAAAEQRAGRAGRTGPGQAYRLYTEVSHAGLNPFTVPEIQRCALSSLIMQLKSLGVGNIANFDMPTRMPTKNMHASLEHLFSLGAIDSDGELTQYGSMMSELPFDPQLAKILLESPKYICTRECIIIVSMLQCDNIFLKPSSGNHSIKAKKAHFDLQLEEGDLITLLNIYNEFVRNRRSRRWSEEKYLNHNGLLRAEEIKRRLEAILSRFKIKLGPAQENFEQIRKCLVSGLFANAAYLHYDGEYRTIRGNHQLIVHPSSVINNVEERPKYVIFTEILHTTQVYMKNLVAVEAEWLYNIASHYYHFGIELDKLRG